MNREHWKKILPFVQAFADGKHVELLTESGNWVSQNEVMFSRDASNYRIAEPPKLRPWKPSEVPMLALIRWKDTPTSTYHQRSCITSHGESSIWLGSASDGISFKEAFRTLEHSTDGGKTWHPCGVIEGGAA